MRWKQKQDAAVFGNDLSTETLSHGAAWFSSIFPLIMCPIHVEHYHDDDQAFQNGVVTKLLVLTPLEWLDIVPTKTCPAIGARNDLCFKS
jgi:hypothetical protein